MDTCSQGSTPGFGIWTQNIQWKSYWPSTNYDLQMSAIQYESGDTKRSPTGETNHVCGKRAVFFVDYSKHTALRRKAFGDIRNRSTKEGIANFLLHPATLKVTIGKEAMLFKCAEEAEKFTNSLNEDHLLGSDDGAVGSETISSLPQDNSESAK